MFDDVVRATELVYFHNVSSEPNYITFGTIDIKIGNETVKCYNLREPLDSEYEDYDYEWNTLFLQSLPKFEI